MAWRRLRSVDTLKIDSFFDVPPYKLTVTEVVHIYTEISLEAPSRDSGFPQAHIQHS